MEEKILECTVLLLNDKSIKFDSTAKLVEHHLTEFHRFWYGLLNLPEYLESKQLMREEVLLDFGDGRSGVAMMTWLMPGTEKRPSRVSFFGITFLTEKPEIQSRFSTL